MIGTKSFKINQFQRISSGFKTFEDFERKEFFLKLNFFYIEFFLKLTFSVKLTIIFSYFSFQNSEKISKNKVFYCFFSKFSSKKYSGTKTRKFLDFSKFRTKKSKISTFQNTKKSKISSQFSTFQNSEPKNSKFQISNFVFSKFRTKKKIGKKKNFQKFFQ